MRFTLMAQDTNKILVTIIVNNNLTKKPPLGEFT